MASERSAAQAVNAPVPERSATPFNYLEYPTDIVLLVVVYRLRYKLSLRDVAELLARARV